MDINYKIKDIQSSDSSVDLSGMAMGAGLSLDVNNKKHPQRLPFPKTEASYQQKPMVH